MNGMTTDQLFESTLQHYFRSTTPIASTSKDDVFPAAAEDEFRERPRRPKPRASYENVWIPPREKEGADDNEEEATSTPEVSTASSSCRSSLNHEDKAPSSVPPTLPRRNTREAIQ